MTELRIVYMLKKCLVGSLFVILSLSNFVRKANSSGDSSTKKASVSATEDPIGESSYLRLANDI